MPTMMADPDGEKPDGKVVGRPISSMLFLTTQRNVALRDLSVSREFEIEAIRSFLKLLILSLLFILILSAILLAVYEIANKAVGEAAVLVGLFVGVTLITLAAHCTQCRQRKQTEILVSELREREKDLFKRLDKEIKSIVTKGS